MLSRIVVWKFSEILISLAPLVSSREHITWSPQKPKYLQQNVVAYRGDTLEGYIHGVRVNEYPNIGLP